MAHRPFVNFGRSGLAACAVSLAVASLSAQTAPSTTAPVGPNPSRVDVFLGFSYFGAHGQVKPAGINYSSINEGAIGSGAYYFNKYVGAEVNFVAHPDGNNDGLYSASGGMIARAPMQNFTLFAHGLAGAANLGGPNNEAPAQLEHEPYRWGPTLTAGGGMDYDLPFFDNRFSLRLFEGRLSLHPHRLRSDRYDSDRWRSGRSRQSFGRRPEHGHRGALWPHHPAASGDLLLRCEPELGVSRRSGHGDWHPRST